MRFKARRYLDWFVQGVFLVLISCAGNEPTKSEDLPLPGIEDHAHGESLEDSLESINDDPIFVRDTISILDSIYFRGYIYEYQKLPKLSFSELSQMEYLALAPISERSSILEDSATLAHYFTTKQYVYSFIKYGFHQEYEGYSGIMKTDFKSDKAWHVFSTHNEWEGLGFGSMMILDSLTDICYSIVSIGDWSVETPILSPDGKYLVYFYNYVYDHSDSFVGVLRVNEEERENPEKYLVPYMSLESHEWAVEEIKWTEENTLLLKTYVETRNDSTGDWEKTFVYREARLN